MALRANESLFFVAIVFDPLLIVNIAKVLMLVLFGTFSDIKMRILFQVFMLQ